MAEVRLENISKSYEKHCVFEGLSLTIRDGECFTLLGPSGCGKTVILRLIAGFEHPTTGEILIGNTLVSSAAKRIQLPPESRKIGVVFENVAFPLRIKKLSKSEMTERTRRALEHTGLLKVESSYPNALSGGQMQRIALARAIAINPVVMLLDEPLSNLDPKLREEMRFEIKDLQKKFGFTIIYVTHDQAEAMALSDRMLVMNLGVVQQVDAPMNIYNSPVNKFVFSFIGLSNFIPVEISDGKVYVKGAQDCGSLTQEIPESVKDKQMTLACRPSEIELTDGEGLKGIIKRKVYLGDIIDYRVGIGNVEIRVQKNRRKSRFNEGDPCRLKFNRLLWYIREEQQR